MTNKTKLFDLLEKPVAANAWLRNLRLDDLPRAFANLKSIARWEQQDRRTCLLSALGELLPSVGSPDMAINNLERFLAHGDADEADQLFANDRDALPDLLRLFSSSQYLADLICHDPALYRWLRQTGGKPCTREFLDDQLATHLASAATETDAMDVLRNFKHRQTLRIAFGDLILDQRIEHVTQQISWLADAMCDAALGWSRKELVARFGEPLGPDGQPARLVVLALGKLGGLELNYSSDIDLIMIYDHDGKTTGRPYVANQQFFDHQVKQIVSLLGATTSLGSAYRVDLRLRPHGTHGPICMSVKTALRYYDFQGRTWERQAFIKARSIAGDLKLGQQLLKQLSPWIYHRNLSRMDIAGITGVKRRIERRTAASGEHRTNIKTGHGGIRDIEFSIQFLQLLNGSLVDIRGGNTLVSIKRLERESILTPLEGSLLFHNYSWLRKLEHRLQIFRDLQTHTLPTDPNELRKTAIRMGYRDRPRSTAVEQFQSELEEKTAANRMILNHLLHSAFGPVTETDPQRATPGSNADPTSVPPEVDLILDSDPDDEMIARVLQPYGFRDASVTWRRLMELANESTRFLSPRRCRHFFAAIARDLLTEVACTPDPDATLVSLTTISDSLGGKGILWELFSYNPPTLRLYVRLCALTDYLASILKQNPGMIDELMDALHMQQLPNYDSLASEVAELTRGAEDLQPILHSFRNTQHIRIGVRDLVQRDSVRDVHRTLADVASVCLSEVTDFAWRKLLERYGKKSLKSARSLVPECPLVILGMGKLGGREPNYHSDMDLIFLYETQSSLERYLNEDISRQFFFSELAAKITRLITHSPRYGRLYEVDSRLRPTGKSGPLAVSIEEFERYFQSGSGQLWERQALCKARPVYGTKVGRIQATYVIRRILTLKPWQPEMAAQIHQTREAMEADCSGRNLKRGRGGTMDVEFAIQMLQLKWGKQYPAVLVPGTFEAIEQLVLSGVLSSSDGTTLADCYQLLRGVESRLRLMNTTARHDLPSDANQLAKLASLMSYRDADKLELAIAECRGRVRGVYDRLFQASLVDNDS